MMGTTSSITVQSLGKIAQCTPAVGAKIWCLSLPSSDSIQQVYQSSYK